MNKTAVLIPCYNEEKTIAKVVQDFKTEIRFCRLIEDHLRSSACGVREDGKQSFEGQVVDRTRKVLIGIDDEGVGSGPAAFTVVDGKHELVQVIFT